MRIALGLVLALAGIIWHAVLYWSNPDMTKQRLLLTFWPEYIIIILLTICGSVLVAWGTRK